MLIYLHLEQAVSYKKPKGLQADLSIFAQGLISYMYLSIILQHFVHSFIIFLSMQTIPRFKAYLCIPSPPNTWAMYFTNQVEGVINIIPMYLRYISLLSSLGKLVIKQSKIEFCDQIVLARQSNFIFNLYFMFKNVFTFMF